MSIQTKSLGAKASLSVLGFSAAEVVLRRCVRLAPSGDRRHRRGGVAVATGPWKPSIAS